MRISENRYRVWSHDIAKPREQMTEFDRLRDVLSLTFRQRVKGLPCWCATPCDGPEKRSHTCSEARSLLRVPDEATLKTDDELDYDAYLAALLHRDYHDFPALTFRQHRRAKRYVRNHADLALDSNW